MSNLVSVIIPVYNAEKYLRECLDSVLTQTFEGFELLLINDGSTDNSGSICEEYAKSDSRVVVFHKKNNGVSAARNTGIDKSNGKFIVFVDSDDYVENATYKQLLDILLVLLTLLFWHFEYHQTAECQFPPEPNEIEC